LKTACAQDHSYFSRVQHSKKQEYNDWGNSATYSTRKQLTKREYNSLSENTNHWVENDNCITKSNMFDQSLNLLNKAPTLVQTKRTIKTHMPQPTQQKDHRRRQATAKWRLGRRKWRGPGPWPEPDLGGLGPNAAFFAPSATRPWPGAAAARPWPNK